MRLPRVMSQTRLVTHLVTIQTNIARTINTAKEIHYYGWICMITPKAPVPVAFGCPMTMLAEGVVRSSKSP